MELYKSHRPTEFEDVVGQTTAVANLMAYVATKRVPHAILFVGPSGTGKTTLARILQAKLGCHPADFKELNCADFRGIDMVRDIRMHMGLAPQGGRCRVWLIDEASQLTGDAQDAFLKILEDTPRHVYFMLATTLPAKLKKTIITRCTEVVCEALAHDELITLINKVAAAEGIAINDPVAIKIAEAAEGSARKALVILDAVALAPAADAAAQLAIVAKADLKAPAIQIARALMSPQTKWPAMAKILKDLKDEDPEGLRHLILAYCTAILLKGKSDNRAFAIIEEFSHNFWDSKRAGLVAACYAVVNAKQ